MSISILAMLRVESAFDIWLLVHVVVAVVSAISIAFFRCHCRFSFRAYFTIVLAIAGVLFLTLDGIRSLPVEHPSHVSGVFLNLARQSSVTIVAVFVISVTVSWTSRELLQPAFPHGGTSSIVKPKR